MMAYMLQHWTNHLGAALSLDHTADAEMDRQVYYCLDAPDMVPTGSASKIDLQSFTVRGNHE